MSSLLPSLSPVVDEGTDAPSMPYWRLFTRPDGLSSVAMAMLDGFAKKSVGGRAAAMWMRAVRGTVEAVQFVILPVGWVGEWHESPTAQWVVTLSGRWFIETQDGTRIEMGPGEIHWGQDWAPDRSTATMGIAPANWVTRPVRSCSCNL